MTKRPWAAVGLACPYCGLGFMRRSKLHAHRERCPKRPAGVTPFRTHTYLCAHCSAPFRTELATRTHEQTAHPAPPRPGFLGYHRRYGGQRLPGKRGAVGG